MNVSASTIFWFLLPILRTSKAIRRRSFIWSSLLWPVLSCLFLLSCPPPSILDWFDLLLLRTKRMKCEYKERSHKKSQTQGTQQESQDMEEDYWFFVTNSINGLLLILHRILSCFRVEFQRIFSNRLPWLLLFRSPSPHLFILKERHQRPSSSSYGVKTIHSFKTWWRNKKVFIGNGCWEKVRWRSESKRRDPIQKSFLCWWEYRRSPFWIPFGDSLTKTRKVFLLRHSLIRFLWIHSLKAMSVCFKINSKYPLILFIYGWKTE